MNTIPMTCGQVREAIDRHPASGNVVTLTFDDKDAFPVESVHLSATADDYDRFIIPKPDGTGLVCLDKRDSFVLGPDGMIHATVCGEGYAYPCLIKFLRPAPLAPHRHHKADCGHEWDAVVRLGQTTNLSGELPQYCPTCDKRALTGSPWFFVAPDPSPLDNVIIEGLRKQVIMHRNRAEAAIRILNPQ